MHYYSKQLFALLLLIFFSCSLNDEIKISGITYTSEFGNMSSLKNEHDNNDWKFNYTFNNRERLLFDSLKFNNTATSEDEFISTIVFYPNPFNVIGNIYFYNSKHILNIVIVDKSLNKKLEFRLSNSTNYKFDLSTLNKGIYRMYYVIQNSEFKIIHTGFGDILKE